MTDRTIMSAWEVAQELDRKVIAVKRDMEAGKMPGECLPLGERKTTWVVQREVFKSWMNRPVIDEDNDQADGDEIAVAPIGDEYVSDTLPEGTKMHLVLVDGMWVEQVPNPEDY